MDRPAEVRPESAPGPLARGARGFVFRLCTSNPFYVLSALLVCLGLRMSFEPRGEMFSQLWTLMGGLAAYTLLLAATACLLVRFNNVWDDVRTLLLLVVLLFLATSVTFDDALARAPELRVGSYVVGLYAVGLLFAMGLSEAMLRAMRLRLPIGFRLPYHLILALFFLYPAALGPLLDRPRSPELQWALFGFSPVAGLVFLTLLPAIRRGASYVDKNGSPWRWPLYPWTLFGMLALGVGARSFYLCESMLHLDYPDLYATTFGPYFLVPFLLALDVLLLEAGLVARRPFVQKLAMTLAWGLTVLAMEGHHKHDVVSRGFLMMFIDRLGGTPLYLTLLALLGLFAYAAARRVPRAWGSLSATMVALAFVGPASLDLGGLTGPRPLPILGLGLMQAGLAWRGRDAGRWLAAAGCLAVAAMAGPAADWPSAGRLATGYHLALAGFLAVGAAFDDAVGRFARGAGGLLLATACVAASTVAPESLPALPPEALRAYPPLMAGVALAYGAWRGGRWYYASAATGLAGWLGVAGGRVYLTWRQSVLGLDRIALGLAFFLLAASISLWKAGAWQRWRAKPSDLG